ncbi:hypothetical protein I3843_14G073900 [Carya illinoinensis]|nr:hypothetical protein I3843_14G073900 [Carya illinoinensis]
MDALLKQTRLRLSGVHKEKTEEAGSNRDRRIPIQKSQSFKEKKSQNWLQRQFSRQMCGEYPSDNGIERAAAVAAVAFAIKRLEETHFPDPKKTSKRPETSLTAIKSIKEDKTSLAVEPGRTSKRFAALEKLNPETTPPKSEPPVTFKPTLPPNEIQRQSSSKPGTPTTVTRQQSSTGSVIEETKADAWEKAESARIKDRVNWREGGASDEFRDDLEFIDQIAGGARAKAEEKRNKKENKAREKAKKIRTTGKEHSYLSFLFPHIPPSFLTKNYMPCFIQTFYKTLND